MTSKDQLRIFHYVEHILEALQRIFDYASHLTEKTFLENKMAQDAIIRNLEVIGESSNNLEKHFSAFTSQHSQIPWSEMYWMRNRLSHGYFSIDLEIVWKTVENDLPELQKALEVVHGQLTSDN